MAKVGRPLKYSSPEEMQEAIDAYFDECKENENPPTITGLALSLGFCTRQSLLDYAEKDEFLATVKSAKLRVEESLERGILKGYNAAGGIFNLKNNFGWVDKKEIGHSGEIGLDMILDYSSDE